MIITSRQNPQVAHFRALMRDRKARLESGLFAVEGEKLFHEAVASGLKPEQILLTEKFSQKNDNFCKKAANLCNIDIISDDLAEYISDTKSPQGVFFSLPLLDKFSKLSTLINSTGTSRASASQTTAARFRVIALDEVQTPGNVGAIIRSCDAFGVDALLLSESCADIHSPKVIRSAMGSAFRLPVYRGGLVELKTLGFTVIGAALSDKAEKLTDFSFPEKSVVVIGSEGAGISAQVLALCDSEIYIPIKNAESLNAAVAASIIIYEMRK
ncbi:MAG: RNA methyltransferase [Oscillospiraceae bacterium]|nr:RNA methyltransferase [Oscillospiraceae bacterium]